MHKIRRGCPWVALISFRVGDFRCWAANGLAAGAELVKNGFPPEIAVIIDAINILIISSIAYVVFLRHFLVRVALGPLAGAHMYETNGRA